MNVLRANWPLIEAASRWAGASLALVGFLLLALWAWRARSWLVPSALWLVGRRPRDARARARLCPGPRRAAWRLLVRPCGYDLSGLPTAPSGAVTCPECGRALLPEQRALRRVYRFRPGRAGLAVLLLSALFCRAVPYAKHGHWQRHLPTTVLIAAKRALGPNVPTRLYRELLRRVWDKKLSPWQARLAVPGFLQDLKADRRVSNAWQAANALDTLGVDDAALEPLLTSPDYQQRQLAAHMLRRRCTRQGPESYHYHPVLKAGAHPSDALIRVTVEGLRDDHINWVETFVVDNARSGFWFLLLVPDRIDDHLERAMREDDAQLRLLAAGVAGYAGRHNLVHTAAPILIEHMRDNNRTGDARFSARCLYCFGYDAVPYLARAMNDDDCQLAGLARLILKDLRMPLDRLPRPVAELKTRITVTVSDPARSDLDFGTLEGWR